MKTKAKKRAKGFTLIELLVTVAIIGILAGLLLPVLAKAKGVTIRIKCVSNLKQVGTAFRVFANDHDNRFPHRVPITTYLTPPMSGYFTHLVNPTTTVGSPQDPTMHGSHPGSQPWTHFLTMSNELGSARTLMCPGDRNKLDNLKNDFTTGVNGYNHPRYPGQNSYGMTPFVEYRQVSPVGGVLARQGKDNATSYTVGLQADEKQGSVILSADRNYQMANTNFTALRAPAAGGWKLPMNATNGIALWVVGWKSTNGGSNAVTHFNASQHDAAGNYVLSDGSAHQVTSAGLQAQLRQASSALGVSFTMTAFPR